MLEVDDLVVRYGRVTAVRDISVAARPGQVMVLLGSNGAGKSTTLRSVAGLHAPDSGSIRVDGSDLAGSPAHRMVRAGVVLVPEGRRVFAPFTVLENLRMGAYAAPKASVESTLEQVYEQFPVLRERRGSAAGLLSGGEQQMLAFGRALMSQPRIIMLDEPSMGLSPTMVDTVLEGVRRMADAGITVLMVEQNADAVEIADDVAVMARGEITYRGTAADARSHGKALRTALGEGSLA